MDWQLAEAKNRLSEVVTLALTEGPQRIRRRDQAVVLVSAAEYERLVGTRPSFKQFLFEGPGLHDLDLSRETSPMRDVTL